jgi:hypothetical protein
VRVVEGVGSGARDVRMYAGALPVRAGDGVDGAADWGGGFQVWVHGPVVTRMCAAAGALADDYGAAELLEVDASSSAAEKVLSLDSTYIGSRR